MKEHSTRILYYHVIANQKPDIYPLGISVSSFFRQLSWLKTRGWKFVSLSEALQTNRPKQVCITLDDGLAVNYPVLLQMNELYGIKPTLFLIGKCIDNKALAWNHKLILLRKYVPATKLNQHINNAISGANLSNLFSVISMRDKDLIMDRLWSELLAWTEHEYLARNKPFYTQEQLTTLAAKGIELALHSHTHPDFSRLDKDEAKAEIDLNIQAMENLNLPWHKHFAYPYGRTGSNPHALLPSLNLQASFGTFYKAGDNLPAQKHWQRQCMERNLWQNLKEYYFMPEMRKWKRGL